MFLFTSSGYVEAFNSFDIESQTGFSKGGLDNVGLTTLVVSTLGFMSIGITALILNNINDDNYSDTGDHNDNNTSADNGKTEEPLVYSNLQKPIIESFSSSNLLSINGVEATGKVIVRNMGSLIKKFNISSSNNVVSIDPSSSCLQPVSAGGQCEFKVSFRGNGVGSVETRTPVLLEIGDDSNYSDFIRITTIDMPRLRFYVPYEDETDAHGLNLSGDVTSFATVNKNGIDILYVGSDEKGVFKSTDGGNTWIKLTKSSASLNVQTLYSIASGGEHAGLYVGIYGTGVYKSVDGGASWSAFNGGLLYPESKKIKALHLVNDGKVAGFYVGTFGRGVFQRDILFSGESIWSIFNNGDLEDISEVLALQSIDSNSTNYGLYAVANTVVYKRVNGEWKDSYRGIDTTYSNDLLAVGENLYVGTEDGVYMSSDGANNWSKIGLQGKEVVTLCFVEEGVNAGLYAGVKAQGVFKRNDNTNAWEPFIDGLKNLDVKKLHAMGSGENTILFVGTSEGGVFKRAVGDSSWKRINNELANTKVNVLSLYTPDNKAIYAGTGGYGIFKSVDSGANWQTVSEGLSNLYVKTISSYYNGKNTILYAGTNSGVFSSDSGSINWMASGLEGKYIDYLYSVDNGTYKGLYAGTDSDGVYQKAHGNKSWLDYGSATVIGVDVHALVLFRDDLYAGSSRGVFKRNNTTNDWEPINDGLDSLNSKKINVLHSSQDQEMLYAGTEEGLFAKYFSIDKWETKPLDGKVKSLQTPIAGDEVFYAGVYADGVSRNAGLIWDRIPGLKTIYVNNLCLVGDSLYAGTNSVGGVFKSVTN